MAAQPRSFQELISQLHSHKQDLLRLHYAYSPDAVNYHQIKRINTLKEQVKLAQDKLATFQSQYQAKKKSELSKNHSLQSQNQELLTINEKLVVSNERFKAMLESTQKKKQQTQQQLQRQRQSKRLLQSKYSKQIQNLKLMQAQQLYILRKKQKKN